MNDLPIEENNFGCLQIDTREIPDYAKIDDLCASCQEKILCKIYDKVCDINNNFIDTTPELSAKLDIVILRCGLYQKEY